MRPCFIIFIFLILTGCIQKSFSMAAAMDKFFNNLGTDVNTTNQGSFQSQSAGHYTAGGMMVRQKNKAYQPITISPPSFSAGCSGIDAYFGGISFMNGQQLGQLLRQMGTQAATYALQLGLKTMAPQVEGLLSQLRKLALDANALMVGDCRQVQQIFASALPKGTAFQEHACIDVRRQGGGEDWFGAKDKCSKPEQITSGANEAQKKNPDMLVGEYNLLWHILKKLGSSLTTEEKTIWQTLAGTIVHRKEGERLVHVPYHGKAADDKMWDTMLKGGFVDALACDENDKCLHPQRKQTYTLKGLKEKISTLIRSIQEKYINRAELSPAEVSFLNDVASVPIWKYIQVLSASGSFMQFDAILDHIAIQLLVSQLERILSDVESYLHLIEGHQQESSQLEAYGKRLNNLKTQLRLRQGPLTQQAMFQLNKIVEAEENKVRIINNLNG